MKALAELLSRAPGDEVAVVVGFLVGSPRQGRVGVGWSAVRQTRDVSPVPEASLTVRDVDDALDSLKQTTGPGSASSRQSVMHDLFAAFRKEVLALDPCVTEEFLKLYVAYKAETNFVDVVPQAKRLRLSLNMPFAEISDPKGAVNLMGADALLAGVHEVERHHPLVQRDF